MFGIPVRFVLPAGRAVVYSEVVPTRPTRLLSAPGGRPRVRRTAPRVLPRAAPAPAPRRPRPVGRPDARRPARLPPTGRPVVHRGDVAAAADAPRPRGAP